MRVRTLYFVSLMLTGIAMALALAHLFELPNKIDIGAAHYLIVQRSYDNWSVVGLVVPLAFLSVVALTFALRGSGAPFTSALVALLFLVGELIVFWGFVFPVNQATENWTVLPGNWQQLRAQWEYGHAVRAVLYVLGFGALLMSVLDWRGSEGRLASEKATPSEGRRLSS